MIIDCHGRFMTAPKALEAWCNQRTAGIKDFGGHAEGREPEDQRQYAPSVPSSPRRVWIYLT